MKITEIIRLHSLGYTKEEVKALMEQEKNPEPEPLPDPAPHPAQDPEPDPTTDPAPEPAPDPTADNAGNADILTAINNLTKAIQASNVLKDRQPEEKTGEDVLNDILKGV